MTSASPFSCPWVWPLQGTPGAESRRCVSSGSMPLLAGPRIRCLIGDLLFWEFGHHWAHSSWKLLVFAGEASEILVPDLITCLKSVLIASPPHSYCSRLSYSAFPWNWTPLMAARAQICWLSAYSGRSRARSRCPRGGGDAAALCRKQIFWRHYFELLITLVNGLGLLMQFGLLEQRHAATGWMFACL